MSRALYRRYRPVTFGEVIGQEHVTVPLVNALSQDKVHHAFLFSGPRGCGKTSSARILARSLNCEQGPTPTPCGQCRSCRDLAADGGGSLDVIEIDAASHGRVDDARELLETTAFSPASSRFKIYIIDEAHMVTPSGFNALLKVVEEPPEHVKFVFATTEPEKVLSTIRSRTHHYPFHLVPPSTLETHLAAICAAEGVTVEKGVLPLVVRGGAGSVRDALSLLDQLIAGSLGGHVGYDLTASLLGFTDATLLDDAVEAMAVGDGAELFHVVDRVVESGLDPHRFSADLLERLRDLIILDAVPDAGASILRSCPDDALERMRGQATRCGRASLARAADVVNSGLTEMRGATSPRLQLELICARILLPAVDADERGLYARLERLERRIGVADPSAAPPREQSAATQRPDEQRADGSAGGRQPRQHRPASAPEQGQPEPAVDQSASTQGSRERQRSPENRPSSERQRSAPVDRQQFTPEPEAPSARQRPTSDPTVHPSSEASPPEGQASVTDQEQPAVGSASPDAQQSAAPGGIDLVGVRRLWSEVLDQVKTLRRVTWALVSQEAHVLAVEPDRLVLAMSTAGRRDQFLAGGHDEIVRQALIDILGLDGKVEAVVDPGAAAASATSGPAAGSGEARSSQSHERPRPATSWRATTSRSEYPVAAAQDDAAAGAAPSNAPRPKPVRTPPAVVVAPADDIPDDDDLAAPAQDDALTGQALLERELGARVIEQYDNP